MKQDRIDQKILDYIAVEDKIAIAVSGGIDSMVLLRAVENCPQISKKNYFVVNIEHGIRGESSVSDSAFVKDYCQQKDITFVGASVDARLYADENRLTVEESARLLRYSVFADLLREGKCNKVLLAHHRSDQAETVLMRIIRGTGIQGLMGIKDVNGGYVRPLLDISKQEIIDYQQKYSVPFVEDETNWDNNYTRNLLRNEILPSLKKISADAEGGLVRLSRLATEAEDFISGYDNPIDLDGDCAYMSIIEGEHKLLFKRRVKRCFEALGVNKDVEEIHYDLVYDLLKQINGASLDMPYCVRVSREYDKIVFSKTSFCDKPLSVPFQVGEIQFNNSTLIIEEFGGVQREDTLIFDISKVPQSAVLRLRQEGDRFTKFGGGTKSLGDYLTDKKVPKRTRDSLIVLADGAEILFIAGVEISEKIKVDNDQTKIYSVTLEVR